MTFEYCRLVDVKNSEYDTLEKMCTVVAKDGWRVISISDGSTYRYATLEREVQVGNEIKTTAKKVKE